MSPFCGAIDSPFLDFRWRLFWVSNQGGFTHFGTLLPACNRTLRFTSGATPADLLAANMAAELFQSIYLCTSTGMAWVWELSCHRLNSVKLKFYFYRPQTKLQAGNIFTGVCLFTEGRGGYSLPSLPPWYMGYYRSRSTSKWVVRILLECFLVNDKLIFTFSVNF